VAAESDGKPAADEVEVIVRLGPGFHYSYSEFLHARPPGSRQVSVAELAADRERDLRRLGRGQAIFPGAVDCALTQLLDRAASAGEQVELTIETADAELISIPFEAASLSNGRVPALVVSLVRTGARESLVRALTILRPPGKRAASSRHSNLIGSAYWSKPSE
jgi:hypothetical protein